ncbi:MAG: 7TM diverse intracellular signaling domain-containing protein [Thermonemataceae bacterium]
MLIIHSLIGTMRQWLFVLLLLSAGFTSSAEIIVFTDEMTDIYFCAEDFDLYVDSTNQLSIQEIHKIKEVAFFVDMSNGRPKAVSGNTYWLKFRLSNQSQHSLLLYHFYSHNASQLTLYRHNKDGSFDKQTAGRDRPFSFRDIHHQDFVFELSTSSDTLLYYVKVVTKDKINLSSKIQTMPDFVDRELPKYIRAGLVYGLILMAILVNLLLFLIVRENQYIIYCLYIAMLLLYLLSIHGMGFQYLWPGLPILNDYTLIISNTLMIVLAVLFIKEFLNISLLSTLWIKVLYLVVVYKIMFSVYHYFKIKDATALLYIDLFPFIVFLFIGVVAYIKGYKPARFYVLAHFLLFLSYVLMIMAYTPLFYDWRLPSWSFHALEYGLVLQSVVLSTALADRLKTLKLQREIASRKVIEQLQENERIKDEHNRNLEQKVEERTAVLRIQALRIEKMNALLLEQNKQLLGDMSSIAKARVEQRPSTFEEFKKIYTDDEACLVFLSNLKWKNGFICRKCAYTHFTEGTTPYSRRCSRCSKIESATVDTIFEGTRFPLVKAFYITYITNSSKRVTSEELSKILDLRKQTCWTFAKKVEEAIRKRKKRSEKNWINLLLTKK